MALFLGIFNVILEFVLEFGVSDEAHCQEKILSSCFRFLQKITRKNSRVCQLFLSNLKILLSRHKISSFFHLMIFLKSKMQLHL